MWTEFIHRVRYLFRRSAFDRELDREIEFHVEARASELETEGLSAARALVRARHEFGSTAQMREETYEAWQIPLLEDFAADLRYAARSLLRSPGFTAVAVLSVTLGIGANSAVFTLVEAVLLPSLPVKNPATLVSLYMTDERNREPGDLFMPLSYPNAEDYRKQNRVFSEMAIVFCPAQTCRFPKRASRYWCHWSTATSSMSWAYVRNSAVLSCLRKIARAPHFQSRCSATRFGIDSSLRTRES